MKIGIATCAEKPNLTAGDQAFASALESRGIETAPLIWNDPNALSTAWDVIVVRSVWDYHKRVEEFAKWMADVERSSTRLINDPQTIRWNLDKSYLLELSNRGARCVPTILVSQDLSVVEALDQIKRSGWSEIVMKPTISATAFLTYRCSLSDPELPEFVERIKRHSDILIQPYIRSIENDGEVSLIFFNGSQQEYSHSILKRPQHGDFRVQSDFGGSEVSVGPSPSLIKFADAVLRNISGDWVFARVDVVDWKQRPLLSEVELIEPDLFLSFASAASERFAKAVLEKVARLKPT